MIPKTIKTWQMTEPGKLVRTEIPMPALGPGEALVEIRGCGVCHTDRTSGERWKPRCCARPAKAPCKR
jgi:D-arabinose 1-dehydrogenase-like Zn-dependent alcohol dehydrogenase